MNVDVGRRRLTTRGEDTLVQMGTERIREVFLMPVLK